MTVNEFLQSFQTCRLEAHLKRIKADKMRELVNKLPNYQNVTFASPHAAPTIGPPVAAPRDLPRTSHPTPMYQMPPQPPIPYGKPMPAPRVPVYAPGVPQSYSSYQPPNGEIAYY